MQIIERSVLGVRAACHTFVSAESHWSVTIFPTLRIGEPDFYRAVYDDASNHDVVLVEDARSPVARHFTRNSRWAAPRLGLISQPVYPPSASGRARIVHSDLSDDEFRTEWRKSPAWLRLLLNCAVPLARIRLRWSANRETIAQRAEREDRPSSEEILSGGSEIVGLRDGIRGIRDARLIEHLREELSRPGAGRCRLAVVYGAVHIRAVITELRNRGFRVSESRWLTIFRV